MAKVSYVHSKKVQNWSWSRILFSLIIDWMILIKIKWNHIIFIWIICPWIFAIKAIGTERPIRSTIPIMGPFLAHRLVPFGQNCSLKIVWEINNTGCGYSVALLIRYEACGIPVVHFRKISKIIIASHQAFFRKTFAVDFVKTTSWLVNLVKFSNRTNRLLLNWPIRALSRWI